MIKLGTPLSGQRIVKAMGNIAYTNTTTGHFSISPEVAEMMGFKKDVEQFVSIVPAENEEGAILHNEVPVLILIPAKEDSSAVSKVREGNDSFQPKFVFSSSAAWKLVGATNTTQRYFDVTKENIDTEDGELEVFVLRHTKDETPKPRKKAGKTEKVDESVVEETATIQEEENL